MVVDRFLRYVQVDTQSNADSKSTPSTEKQLNLSKLLLEELKSIGIQDAELDQYGYIYATIPSNIENKDVPAICFCSHVDTAPASSGTNVKPILHKNFDGNDIILPDDTTQIISVKNHPYLKNHIGKDIVTASGLTLLGADDKSGVAIIMQLAENLQKNPNIPHGAIKILFTPDEEIGLGAEHVDIKKLGAKFGYTLDGGDLGDYEDETFNADGAKLIINGVSAHTGDAKGKMINALKLAAEILRKLPNDKAPEFTDGREGFIHADEIHGNTEQVTIEFILRDFDIYKLEALRKLLKNIVDDVVSPYENASFKLDIFEQYRNMKTIIEQYPEIRKKTELAYKRADVTLKSDPIRGGTDGSRLSYMGLPCPNIFTGMQAIHSKHEWIGVQDMEKSLEILTHLVQIWAE